MDKSFKVLFAVILYASLISSGVAQNGTFSKLDLADPETGSARTVRVKAVTIEKVETDVAEALTLIEEQHIDGKNLEYNDLFKATIDSMLNTLDPHSSYFDAAEYRQFLTSQNSIYFGIGATIGDLRDPEGNIVATYIKSTFENAPANRAGLRYGDKIVEIDGKPMTGKPYFTVRDFLRGPRGTVTNVVLERNGSNERVKVEITRDAVSTPSIPEAYIVKPGVGYIAMTGGFNRTTFTEFVDAMKALKAQGMKRLVLDLRGNGGGLVNQAYFIANTFLADGQAIFTQTGRIQGKPQTYQADNANPDATPLVVMVSGSTASASEILAGALQDHDRALIVGENSFGKGLVQNPFPLEYGSMLLLTIAKYETPSGRLIQRDYSDGNLYDYKTNGGSFSDEEKAKRPLGPESRTDSGRVVYGGGGITPDVAIEAPRVPLERGRVQSSLMDPLFSFVLNLTAGKVKGFEKYGVAQPILFDYDIKPNDFPVPNELYGLFVKHASSKYKISPKKINSEREFVTRILRTELITAAYGSQTSFQVFNEYDPQLQKALSLFPQAEQLAASPKRKTSAKKNQN